MRIIYRIWKCTSIGLHLIGTVAYGFTLIYQEFTTDRTDPRSTYVGDFKYMTYWNLIFQFVFNGLSLWADLNPQHRYVYKLRQFNDKFFFFVATPSSMFVCLSFWTLNLLDKNSVRNPNMRYRFPDWYNHVTHTMNGLMNGIELLVTYHSTPDRSHAIIVSITMYAIYQTFLYIFGKYTDVWIYPFMGQLNWTKRVLISVIGGIKLLFYYIASVYLNQHLWPPNRIQRFRQIMS